MARSTPEPGGRPAQGDTIRIEREAFISTQKLKLVAQLADMIEGEQDRDDFLKLCKRIDATVRAWYHHQFEELMQLYTFFDPVSGASKLEKMNLSPEKVDQAELRFLRHLVMILEKSNFRPVSAEEEMIAQRSQYLLHLPITVDESKLDKKLLSTFFGQSRTGQASSNLRFLIYRRGIGIDRTHGLFLGAKFLAMASRCLHSLLSFLGLQPCKRPACTDAVRKKSDAPSAHTVSTPSSASVGAGGGPRSTVTGQSEEAVFVERVRVENMKLSLRRLLTPVIIKEPTFKRMILVYRRASPTDFPHALGDRSIYVKQFQNVPLADMELVLPEKAAPSLTLLQQFQIVIGVLLILAAIVGSLLLSLDLKTGMVLVGIAVTYIAWMFSGFAAAKARFETLLAQAAYDKQLDTGRATLLLLCDEVMQQEVIEVMLAYFVLMTQGRLTIAELDHECESLLRDDFREDVDFEVSDAISKLENLGIVSKDSLGRYQHQSLRRANDIIGFTTEELVERVFRG